MPASVTGAIAVTLLFTACSLGVHGPGPARFQPDGRPMEPVCTESQELPTLDVVLGAGMTAAGVVMLSCDRRNEQGDNGECIGTILAGLPMAAVGMATTLVGLIGRAKVNECREARQRYTRDLDAFTPPPR